ncbi:MAG: polysaccharide biosynthesis protein [Clostridiales bacterium]|nr:polysaccharide biosynthesis protein [Clostridiales bacterium]
MQERLYFQKIKQFSTQNHVIKGTLILTTAGFATRIIGFYNRIFLSRLIGAKELGIYQLIFPLYMIAFAFTTFGNELALTKLVSEYKSRNDTTATKVFFKVCLSINIILGLFMSIIMYKNAGILCEKILKAPECEKCLQIISLGIPFMSTKGAIHGYFLGLEQSGVHGISDFIEQLAKVLGLYILTVFFCVKNSYDAAFAVWGIVIGEVTAFLFSLSALLVHNGKNNTTKRFSIPFSTCYRIFLRDSIPLTTNRLALTILQSMEAILIPVILLKYYKNSTASLATYGIFSGMAFPFIMFPSTITNSLSTMLLPAVSSAHSCLDTDYLKKLCEKSLHFCLLIGLFSLTAFYIFGSSIGICFFESKEAGHYLFQLSFLCPFIYLSTTLTSILNGLGFATHNLILTFISTIIRISFIIAAIPKIGITGYIMGLFTGYLFLTFACIHKLQNIIPLSLDFTESIFVPLIAFILIGVTIFLGYQKLILTLPAIPDIILLIAVIGVYGVIGLLPFIAISTKK